MLNKVELEGILEKKEALRYTLASVPILECTVKYQGTVEEAGSSRILLFGVQAVAVGDTAKRLAEINVGTRLKFFGFLATASARSSKLILHITEYI